MKFHEARRQLQHALKHQKTISIPKLSRIIQAMNISTKHSGDYRKSWYLKGEIKKLKEENDELKRTV